MPAPAVPTDLAADVRALLADTGSRLALAESCTGGLLGATITSVPGASDIFELGVIAYSNAAKQDLLDVPIQTLERTGAVSGPTARAMAAGVRDRADATWGLSITGIAGPTGGRPGKPIGTVYIGLATRQDGRTQTRARRCRFDGDRTAVRAQTVRTALDRLLWVLDHPEPSVARW